MSFAENNGLRYFQFDSLQTRHAVFTRRGGVSPEPWGSLNVGGTVGDDLSRVRQNRQLSFRALD
ncbi:MAG: laccase domain-containing protein, partial [Anaerolineales bacterium]|nr:laccase domain-containing protein [Anaerolineales bacterium]